VATVAALPHCKEMKMLCVLDLDHSVVACEKAAAAMTARRMNFPRHPLLLFVSTSLLFLVLHCAPDDLANNIAPEHM
jgi:hypothetical protein